MLGIACTEGVVAVPGGTMHGQSLLFDAVHVSIQHLTHCSAWLPQTALMLQLIYHSFNCIRFCSYVCVICCFVRLLIC